MPTSASGSQQPTPEHEPPPTSDAYRAYCDWSRRLASGSVVAQTEHALQSPDRGSKSDLTLPFRHYFDKCLRRFVARELDCRVAQDREQAGLDDLLVDQLVDERLQSVREKDILDQQLVRLTSVHPVSSNKSTSFSPLDVEMIADALTKTGAFSLPLSNPPVVTLHYLAGGPPVFELILAAMRELAERMKAEQRAVTVEWSDDSADAGAAATTSI